jgi:hypothetical protein
MNEDLESQTGWRGRKRLVGRLDKMVESGRLTEEEAERLRGAAQATEFDDVVRDIRVRHAMTRLDAAVVAGSVTQVEVDGFLERLRNGEHPRSLRGHLRKLRPERS